MKNQITAVLFSLIFAAFSLSVYGQLQTGELLKRTTYKSESLEFGPGGTVTIIGAPKGSIEIEGWNKNEIEITVEIEVQAATEQELAQLAAVSGYMLDTGFGHTRIISVGAYDKTYLKKAARNFPKALRSMPLRIDYKIKVPFYSDLDIDGGNGDLTVSRVDGSLNLKFLETNAKLDLVGGTVSAAFGSGTVGVTIPAASWRGRNVEVQLASGTMDVLLAQNLNAELDAKVLRMGQIENFLKDLKKRDRTEFTDKLILAKAGSGGASLSFMVGDGSLKLSGIEKQGQEE